MDIKLGGTYTVKCGGLKLAGGELLSETSLEVLVYCQVWRYL